MLLFFLLCSEDKSQVFVITGMCLSDSYLEAMSAFSFLLIIASLPGMGHMSFFTLGILDVVVGISLWVRGQPVNAE